MPPDGSAVRSTPDRCRTDARRRRGGGIGVASHAKFNNNIGWIVLSALAWPSAKIGGCLSLCAGYRATARPLAALAQSPEGMGAAQILSRPPPPPHNILMPASATLTATHTLALVCDHLSDDLSGLSLRRWPLPALGPADARVQMHAASLNFPDLLMTRGLYQFKPALP